MVNLRNTRSECIDCELPKPGNEHLFHKMAANRDGLHSVCKECACKRHKEYRQRPETITKDRDRRYVKQYGITLAQYDDMLEDQDNQCKLCGTDDAGGKGRFHVDHCHSTQVVRGLLCHCCNLMLGQAKDDVTILAKAIQYLQDNG